MRTLLDDSTYSRRCGERDLAAEAVRYEDDHIRATARIDDQTVPSDSLAMKASPNSDGL